MESLLSQTLTKWELVIFHNYSDDGSWQFLHKFTHEPRIRLHQADRQGMSANWNNCLQAARGEYVYVATSCDTCSPTMLEKLVAPLERHPDVALSTCGFDETDENGNVWEFHGTPGP